MISGTKGYCDDIVKRYKCPEHDNPLSVAWHAEANSYVIRCGAGHYPEELTRQPSLTEQYKQGEPVPELIESNIKKGMAKRIPKQPKYAGALTLGGIEAKDLATGQELSEAQVKALVEYAHNYGLDPMRGHVVLMYGKPYITLDGYLYHANKSGKPYTLQSRPLTEEEKPLYQLKEGDYGWLSTCQFTDTGDYFTGTGVVTFDEISAKSPRDANKLRSPVVAAHPWQLAQKRAEWQALRRAFPIGESKEEKAKEAEGEPTHITTDKMP